MTAKKILLAIFVSFFIICVWIYSSFTESQSPTGSSVWIGDADFGCWYDILEVDSDKYIAKIVIYHDYDDDKWNEAYYCNDTKKIKPFTKENIIESILDYDINTGFIVLKGNVSDSLRIVTSIR